MKFPFFPLFRVRFVVSFLVSALWGYLVGSIPVAYLAVRQKANLDIRRSGSGNVGTLNSYLVTRSKVVGGVVLLLDVLKGVVAVLGVGIAAPGDFRLVAFSGVAAVCGHNYPVWLRFQGGRGLATSAGVMLAVAWRVVPLWLLLWGAGFLWTREVNPANALASFLVMLILLLWPEGLSGVLSPAATPDAWFRYSGAAMMGVILVRHIGPLREFTGRLRSRREGGTPRSGGGESL